MGLDCLFEAAGRQHSRLDVGLSFTRLLPAQKASSAILVLGPSLPLHAPQPGQGPPGKRNRKKALRGSRRDAERDSSPFSFTLSFLKGHAKLSRKGNIRTERSVCRRLAGVPPRTGGFQVTDGDK